MSLVVRLPNWVGDTVLALPALEGVVAATTESLVLAGRDGPLRLTSHLAPRSPRLCLAVTGRGQHFGAEVAALRRHGVRRGLLLTPSFSAALWLWLGGVRERIGWAGQGRAFLLSEAVARGPRGKVHLAEEFRQLARRAGAREMPAQPSLPVSAPAAGQARYKLRRFAGPSAPDESWVALCPGAQYGPAKQWPPEHYAALARHLAAEGVSGFVVGGPAERVLGEQIVSAAESPRWCNAAGWGSLRVAAELLRTATVAVSNDSGAMHLAAAVGTRVLALIGPTDPAWTGPLGPHAQWLQGRCPEAPCYARRCRFGEPAPCLAGLSVAEVAAETLRLLRAGGRGVERAGAGRVAPGKRALFLDRDGTLIELVPYLRDAAGVRLLPGVRSALARAQEAGYELVVVSNQSGVARGLFGPEAVAAIEARIDALLEPAGVRIARYLYCPHHPRVSGPCDCRKPAPGLLYQAADELGIDLERSWMVGDTIADVAAGAAAGCRPLLVRTGYGARGAQVDAELPPGTRISADLDAGVTAYL